MMSSAPMTVGLSTRDLNVIHCITNGAQRMFSYTGPDNSFTLLTDRLIDLVFSNKEITLII